MVCTNKSVLVIDDDQTILNLVERILKLEGYRILTARDGNLGLEIIAKK